MCQAEKIQRKISNIILHVFHVFFARFRNKVLEKILDFFHSSMDAKLFCNKGSNLEQFNQDDVMKRGHIIRVDKRLSGKKHCKCDYMSCL